jgi:hypothetical protein
MKLYESTREDAVEVDSPDESSTESSKKDSIKIDSIDEEMGDFNTSNKKSSNMPKVTAVVGLAISSIAEALNYLYF